MNVPLTSNERQKLIIEYQNAFGRARSLASQLKHLESPFFDLDGIAKSARDHSDWLYEVQYRRDCQDSAQTSAREWLDYENPDRDDTESYLADACSLPDGLVASLDELSRSMSSDYEARVTLGASDHADAYEDLDEDADELERAQMAYRCDLSDALLETYDKTTASDHESRWEVILTEYLGTLPPEESDISAYETDADVIEGMPTLCVGQAEDLKIDDGAVRIWLARVGPDDGFTGSPVQVERLRDGKWVNTTDEDLGVQA